MGTVTEAERERRQREFFRLFEATLSDLAEDNDEKFNILKEGSEGDLQGLIQQFEPALELTLDELVSATDGLIVLGRISERLYARRW